MKKQLLWFALFLVLAAAAVRVLRHFGLIHLPPNVAPIAALAMFSSVYLPRRLALVMPLAAMLLADALIGWYTPGIMLAVYGSFLVSSAIGLWIRSRKHIGTIIAGTLGGSIFFFLTTNAAVWMFGTLYPRTMTGLVEAYVAGWPFFRYTALGDLAFTGLLFGTFELAVLFSRRRGEVPQEMP